MKTSGYTYDYFIDSFEKAKDTASELTNQVNEEQYFLKPHPKKWCMAEILSHLNQAGQQYQEQIQKGLDRSDHVNSAGSEPFSPNLFIQYFIKSVSPENERPLPTVPSFKPLDKDDLVKEEILSDFIRLQDAFLNILASCKSEEVDLDKVMTKNPIVKFVPMSLTSCFAVTEAHQRRHFQQMRALKEQM